MSKQITRNDAAALLAEQGASEIVTLAQHQSAVLGAFRRVDMPAGTVDLPVVTTLPEADWVTDTGESTDAKPTTNVGWQNKVLRAEEIACIVPVHENTLEDSRFDVWEEVKPLVATAFARRLDSTVLFGDNKPSTFATAIVPGAVAASRVHTQSSATDLAGDFNAAFGLVEDAGHEANVVFAGPQILAGLRGLRDKNGQPIYLQDLRADGIVRSIYGQMLTVVRHGGWKASEAVAIVGDASKAIVGVRSDMQVKLLDQATVGGINLAERDMVALRFKFRVAYQIADTVAGLGHPFAVIKAA